MMVREIWRFIPQRIISYFPKAAPEENLIFLEINLHISQTFIQWTLCCTEQHMIIQNTSSSNCFVFLLESNDVVNVWFSTLFYFLLQLYAHISFFIPLEWKNLRFLKSWNMILFCRRHSLFSLSRDFLKQLYDASYRIIILS